MENLLTDGIELKYQPRGGVRSNTRRRCSTSFSTARISRRSPRRAKGRSPSPITGSRPVPIRRRGLRISRREYVQQAYTVLHVSRRSIMPTSTVPEELCVNGMSFSKRGASGPTAVWCRRLPSPGAMPSVPRRGARRWRGSTSAAHRARGVAHGRRRPDRAGADRARLHRGERERPRGADVSYRLGVVPARLGLQHPPAVTEAVREPHRVRREGAVSPAPTRFYTPPRRGLPAPFASSATRRITRAPLRRVSSRLASGARAGS